MAIIMENSAMRNRNYVFADRHDGGRQLAEMLCKTFDPNSMVLAIPSGGVPVGLEISRTLGLDFDLIMVRKIQIPWNTEAGFGAVNMDGDLFINDHLLSLLKLSTEQVELQVRTTMATLEQRDKKFRQNRPFPEIKGRPVILVDDGLASGYTMRAAVAYLRKKGSGAITVAVPTGSGETVKAIMKKADTVCCLNIRESYPFAVASAYRNWYDLNDDEVMVLLAEMPSLSQR